MPPSRPAEERFWEKVEIGNPDECWNWTASTYTSGYGQFWTGTKLTSAHRFVNEMAFGPVPDNIHVLHKCDNKLCCNVKHHFRGTALDNVTDMLMKGRNNQPKGERQRSAKLNSKQVQQIRELVSSGNHTYSSLARGYGVSVPTIRNIAIRKTWKHI